MQAVLDMLAGALPERGAADLDDWLARLASLRSRWPRPIDRAIVAGFCADRLGYAFAGGYQAALETLAGELDRTAALCVTEAGGHGPRAIETLLSRRGSGGVVSGEKTFVTLGDRAAVLLVAATLGPGDDGRPQIRLVAIERDSPGVSLEPALPTPFAPEIPHARLHLDEVEVLPQPGLETDGYPHIKAFRTIEDICVLAATAACAIAAARARRAARPVEVLLPALVALRSLADVDPLAPATHLALAGVHSAMLSELDAPAWIDGDEGDRWRRDRPLLHVAGKARALRAQRAREALKLDLG